MDDQYLRLPVPVGTVRCPVCGFLPADGDVRAMAEEHTGTTTHLTLYQVPAPPESPVPISSTPQRCVAAGRCRWATERTPRTSGWAGSRRIRLAARLLHAAVQRRVAGDAL
jgi:hypothetical protein